MNGYDILLLVLIAAALALAVYVLRRKNKRGGSCCGDCAACAMKCEKEKER